MNSSHLNFFLGQATAGLPPSPRWLKSAGRGRQACRRSIRRETRLQIHRFRTSSTTSPWMQLSSVRPIIGTRCRPSWRRTPEDVYCEKPLTVTVRARSRHSSRPAKQYRLSGWRQQRTEYGGKFRQAVECAMAESEEVKKVKMVSAPAVRCDLPIEAKRMLDWEMWLGPAPSAALTKSSARSKCTSTSRTAALP